jgi:tetratricopeptide (TPR) repeat protein
MTAGHRSRLAIALGLFAGLFCSVPASAQSPVAQSNRASELIRAGKYLDALPLAQAAVASLEKTGPGSRDFAGALNNLAQLYGDLGRDADAEPVQKRALAIMEKVVGLDSPDIAPEMNNLAALYQRKHRYADAEPLFKRALSIREQAVGSDHPETAVLVNNLAALYQDEGRSSDALPLVERVIAAERAQLRVAMA